MAMPLQTKQYYLTLNLIKMNIKTAYNTLTQKQFVDWALLNKYPYFIKIEGNRESGWIYPKKGNTRYKFDYNPKNI